MGKKWGHGLPATILFEVAGEMWAIAFEDVQEVLAAKEITLVPKAPTFIRGIVNVRGKIFTVIDPALLMNRKEREDGSGRVLCLRSDKVNLGIYAGSTLSTKPMIDGMTEGNKMVREPILNHDSIVKERIILPNGQQISLLSAEKIIDYLEHYQFR